MGPFFLCSISQHIVQHQFLTQCSMIHQLRIQPSAYHNMVLSQEKVTSLILQKHWALEMKEAIHPPMCQRAFLWVRLVEKRDSVQTADCHPSPPAQTHTKTNSDAASLSEQKRNTRHSSEKLLQSHKHQCLIIPI